MNIDSVYNRIKRSNKIKTFSQDIWTQSHTKRGTNEKMKTTVKQILTLTKATKMK